MSGAQWTVDVVESGRNVVHGSWCCCDETGNPDGGGMVCVSANESALNACISLWHSRWEQVFFVARWDVLRFAGAVAKSLLLRVCTA